MDDASPVTEVTDFDPDALREKYREERDKRLRPDGNAQYPLEKALSCTALGQWMQKNRIEVFGWVNPSANLSSSNFTNFPLSYAARPNRKPRISCSPCLTRSGVTVNPKRSNG